MFTLLGSHFRGMQVVKAGGMWLQSSGGRDEERGGEAAMGKWLGLCNLEPMVLGNKQHGEWMVVTEKAAMAATRARKRVELDGSVSVLRAVAGIRDIDWG